MRVVLLIFGAILCASAQTERRRVGKFTEVYAWKQMTFNINGNTLSQDRATSDGLERTRSKRDYSGDAVYFDNTPDEERNWNQRYPSTGSFHETTPPPKLDERSNSFFIQYNNLPMGAERVGNRLFVTLPRRRYGVPSTLNYIDLRDTSRSPALRPYPSLQASKSLVSVYRTRADDCGRLWAVDTGLLEIPDNPQQVQRPSIVVFDLRTDRQILKYELKESDVPANNTPTGLASITVDTSNGCANAFAYIPDLTTFGIVVYSLRDRDSWRVTHNYLHFNPAAVNLDIAGQRFQWSDGVFSIALARGNGCRPAFFHPMISTQEFAVNTCTLNNSTAHTDSNYWTKYFIVGERGSTSQSTMHDMHSSGVMFYADIGADGVACWNTNRQLAADSFYLLATDPKYMSYPADLHVTGDEVWLIANTLPRFGYARLDPNEYNFFIYKASVRDLISGTVCDSVSDNDDSNMLFERISNAPATNAPLPPSGHKFHSSTYNNYNL